jgi:hypothetical protein
VKHALLALAVLLAAAEARAYPHYQLTREAARCSSCHYSPAGGGMLNAFGRYHSGESLSAASWPWSATPGHESYRESLHGIGLPEWLDVGGGLRTAVITNSSKAGREWRLVPMQVDLATHVAVGSVAADATFGLRGFARAEENPVSSYFISREHTLTWRRDETGIYARAGRFMPVYGLRLHDHNSYVRRWLGLGLLDESYGAGAGFVDDRFEAHATGFFYNPQKSASQDARGGALTAEVRLGTAGALGASALVAQSPAQTRGMGGLTGKLRVDGLRLTLLGELDLVRRSFAEWQRDELAGYAGAVHEVTRGLFAGAAYEYYDEDTALRATERHAFSGWLAYMPQAHWELFAGGRLQIVGPVERAQMALIMLHYYL